MALTAQDRTALRTIIAREGSVEAVITAARDLDATEQRGVLLNSIGASSDLTVSDWPAVLAAAAQVPPTAAPALLNEIGAAVASRDAKRVGPLLIALYGAARKLIA